MSRILFVDFSCDLTHESVKERPIGASEFMYYTTLYQLSTLLTEKEFICFNKIESSQKIDNVQYKNKSELLKDTRIDDIVLIQRFFPDLDTLSKIKSQHIFLIQHDYDFSAIFGQFQIGENRNKIIPYVVYSPHIHFVLNSEFSKNFIQQNFMHYGITLQESRTHVVPNYIFKDSFPKRTDIVKKRFQLVYASGWNKGIHSIIQIFDYILQKDKRFQLVLMSPGYEYKNYEQMRTFLKEKYKDNIIILGPLSKSIYSKTIQESGCVFAPPFPETFGCVFSESYYLETAVVADQRSGAVVEIIGQENITNYNDLEKTYKKVLECIEKPVQLNERFLFDVNMWKQVLQI